MEIDSSFDQIYEQLFPVVYRFVKVRIPSNDVDDVTAEIIAKVWRALPKFEEKSNLKTWALRIAYNQIADYYRARKNVPQVSLTEELKSIQVESDHSEQLTTLLSVNETLSKLSEPQVAVIQLRLIEGFSAAEVAGIMGTSQQAVDSLLYRAKKSFRKYYVIQGTGGRRL
ncbi:MAG: sigma-70 family RNA polymerase sigma factor [Desulfitobacterium hafniense]|nr:sigma-70 family RNA polymerase sigma factor [Desulfitobacterium hafniense]